MLWCRYPVIVEVVSRVPVVCYVPVAFIPGGSVNKVVSVTGVCVG